MRDWLLPKYDAGFTFRAEVLRYAPYISPGRRQRNAKQKTTLVAPPPSVHQPSTGGREPLRRRRTSGRGDNNDEFNYQRRGQGAGLLCRFGNVRLRYGPGVVRCVRVICVMIMWSVVSPHIPRLVLFEYSRPSWLFCEPAQKPRFVLCARIRSPHPSLPCCAAFLHPMLRTCKIVNKIPGACYVHLPRLV